MRLARSAQREWANIRVPYWCGVVWACLPHKVTPTLFLNHSLRYAREWMLSTSAALQSAHGGMADLIDATVDTVMTNPDRAALMVFECGLM